MAKILGVGIATLDIINHVTSYPDEDSETRCTDQTITRGGNVTNTLTVLSQLNHDCYWAGTLADEPDSRTVEASLDQYKISKEFVFTHKDSKTPTSYITLNKENGSRTIVHYRNLNELSFEEFKTIPVNNFDWIHFEARNINETKKILIYLNQHYPNIPISVEFEKYREGIEELFEFGTTHIFSKAFCLSSKDKNPVDFLNTRISLTPTKTIILAWGDTGSYAISNDKEPLFVPAYFVDKPIDTLGAGDTFNAGIIDNLLKGYNIKKTLEKSNELAAHKISVNGFDISNYDG